MKVELIENLIKRMIKRIEVQLTEQHIYSKNVEKLSLKMIKLKIECLLTQDQQIQNENETASSATRIS